MSEMKSAGYMHAATFSLEEALNRHPCKECGRHYNDHNIMSQAEIDDARSQDCVVEICRTFDGNGAGREDRAFFCVVITPAEDPCDVTYLEGISS